MPALRRTLLFVAALVVLALPATALAADSSVQGYGGPGGSAETSLGGDPGSSSTTAPGLRSPTATKADSGSNLPFTGLDVGFVASVGFGLVLMGVGLALVLRGHRRVPALASAAPPSARGQSLAPLAGRTDGDAALIVAMEMMLDGNTRDEVSSYLSQVFRIENAGAVADEAFRRSQARKRSALAIPVPARLGRK
jgi:hypothetical protein